MNENGLHCWQRGRRQQQFNQSTHYTVHSHDIVVTYELKQLHLLLQAYLEGPYKIMW